MKSTEYQASRKHLLEQVDNLRSIRDNLTTRDAIFVNGLPADVRQKMLLLDRESTRLRNPDLKIAFVGGFSAGKSSLVNAFLGRYLLPESVKVTTAVPTFVRSATDEECAELHYLSEAEVENLGELYRKEIANVFRLPELITAPFVSLLEQVKPLANEGRGRRLVEQFQAFHEQRHRRQIDPRGRVVTVSLTEAQDNIRDENEAMFLDRVDLRIRDTSIPQDVVLVDLPGVSVPNPRHREITFRFVRDDAHALVFVLNSTQIFNKDEVEIMDLFRSGENRIADKTFWVLNRWDALNTQQQRQAIADFETKMHEFAVPKGYQFFRTNALHGLLSQLGVRGEAPNDLALQGHLKDYEDNLAVKFGGSHHTAMRESQIPQLQEQVLGFLNNRLRQLTLRSACENSETNFCEPLRHHLRQAKEGDDAMITGDLSREEREVAHQRVHERFQQRTVEIRRDIQDLCNQVAVERAKILSDRTKELVDALRNKIKDGPETDAFFIYQEIIAGRELRKYPYHFEIEMQIVDNLNTMLKQNFRRIVRQQVEEVFQELSDKVANSLEKVRKDVADSVQVMAPFKDIIRQESRAFSDRVDGVVMTLAAQLDELLLFTPTSIFWPTGGNKILAGLEQAARLGVDNLKNPGQSIQQKDFEAKTLKIRQTLTEHYIQKVQEYYKQISNDIFVIVINNIQQIRDRIQEVMQSKYRPSLEIVLTQEISGEFASKRKGIEDRSRRFRDVIEQIDIVRKEMATVVANLPTVSELSENAAEFTRKAVTSNS